MTSANPVFRLKVSRFDAICQFELTWGQGQCLTARLTYPKKLDQLYQDWRQAYLNFYHSKRQLLPVEDASPMRARVVSSGDVVPSIDWQASLIDAEMQLLRDFQNWLDQGDLRDIRKTIAAASRQLEATNQKIDVFLTCEPIDLVRLPWETWEITDDLAARGKIRIARAPSNSRTEVANPKRLCGKRARILAICCDDVGLNLSQEQQILKSLEPLVYVRVIGWATDKEQLAQQVQRDIIEAIEDEQGWDILFFAGHSDETQMAGGCLAIAPNASLTIEELKPSLTIAKNHGLQLAIFNSCSGLSIAESLMDLGLNEVVVMRERIHNQVAQEFLVEFARGLKAYKDVHESVQDATQRLSNSRQRIQYPSAYLVPSLFRRGASLRLSQPDWRQWLGAVLPKKRYEVVAVGLLSVLSLLPSVQLGLLDQRLLMQAWYRELTQQVESDRSKLALIRIDDESIKRDRDVIGDPNPMSHKYIAQLIQKLSDANVKVIGVDYLLDIPDEDSPSLAKTVKTATDRGTHFVFGKFQTDDGVWQLTPVEIADPRNIHASAIASQGSKFHIPLQIEQLDLGLPLAYWLTWFHRLCLAETPMTCERSSVAEQEALAHFYARQNLPQLYQSPMSALAYILAKQLWFHPIIDYSIPPGNVYIDIPAWKLLHEPNAPELKHLSQQTAMIISGGYIEAGLAPGMSGENFTPPQAMRHWYIKSDPTTPHRQMTQGESQAYLFHHLLHQRLALPIPDLLMVWLAAIVGKGVIANLQAQSQTKRNYSQNTKSSTLIVQPKTLYLIGGTLVYTIFSLQLYLSSLAILLPILLPTVMFWSYILPVLRKK
jgi:hypothetical protein